tara:strand:+ start:269 stop:511 length:243 start_codon:yes stop_codon:yes gene_type:complete
MVTRKVKFTFSTKLIKKPVIYHLGKSFDIVTNIRRAEIHDSLGWVVLELEGTEAEIQKGLNWMKEEGVIVDPVQGDIIAG